MPGTVLSTSYELTIILTEEPSEVGTISPCSTERLNEFPKVTELVACEGQGWGQIQRVWPQSLCS